MENSDEKLLELNGIRKQVIIPLFRVNIDTVLIEGYSISQKADRKQRSKPRFWNPTRKELPYKCSHPNCNYQNEYYCNVRDHMIIHSTETPFECQVCSKAFKSAEYLRQHSKVHSQREKKFACSQPDCKFKTAFKGNLKIHILTHSTERSFKCEVCHELFKTAATLKGHLVTHSDERKFVCSFPGCSSTFRQSSALDVHSKRHTSSEKPFQCTVCGWRSRYKHCVQNHMVSLHGAEGKKYNCEKCDHATSSWNRLKAHRLRVHPESSGRERPKLKCSQCKFTAHYPGQLKAHLRVHLEVKPFSCSFCEFKTITQEYLNGHMRRHTGEKPYACSQCDFRAATRAGVNNHFNVHHNKARKRNHKCAFCSKTFFTRSELNAHMRTHTGEKPHLCPICGEEFATSLGYKHLKSCKRRHGISEE